MAGKYLVYTTKNRETGTKVELYDTKHADNKFDTAVRWIVLCTEHENTVAKEKQSDAYKAMTSPSEWCDDCSDLKASGQKVGGAAVAETEAEAEDDESEDDEDEDEDEDDEEEVTIDPKN